MELSRQGIKKMCECKSTLAEEMPNDVMTLQVVEIMLYSDADVKKGIKARIVLSDGNNTVICMVMEKTYSAMVRKKISELFLEIPP